MPSTFSARLSLNPVTVASSAGVCFVAHFALRKVMLVNLKGRAVFMIMPFEYDIAGQ